MLTVESPDATVNFADVLDGGTTSFTQIFPESSEMPEGYTLCPTCPAYEITTSANYSPPVTVCFAVPSDVPEPTFLGLRMLHGEDGVYVDRTSGRFTNGEGVRFVCGIVNSLSPFALATNFAPTAAEVSISGRALSAEGRGMQNTLVTLTRSDGTIKTAISNPFGYFRINNVAAGETYIISARSKRVQFANQTQVVFVSENITDLVFNAFPE